MKPRRGRGPGKKLMARDLLSASCASSVALFKFNTCGDHVEQTNCGTAGQRMRAEGPLGAVRVALLPSWFITLACRMAWKMM